jgi:ABC-type transporter MlaC component
VPVTSKIKEVTVMLKHLPVFFMLVAMLVASTAIAEPSPTDEVRSSVEAVIALLKDDQLDRQSRRDRMREVIDKRFDFRAMSQRTLATNWKRPLRPRNRSSRNCSRNSSRTAT